jgi:ABC-type transport system involved in Fe-S cluster assembly fused permease/ATPase subunit
VGRAVGVSAFEHIMGLDMSFHLGRQTGSLSRVVERGTRAVAMVYRAAIFTFLPTILEIMVVCGLLYRAFSPATAGLVLATFVAYVAWTVTLTGVAAERRKLANQLDTEASGKLVDTLLNFETVSTFNGQGREVGKYDSMLTGYLQAALQAEYASTALNMGQAVVLATGMTAILVNVAQGCVAGASTVGDIVMAQGLLLQVWAPLQFLGWFYRELRQSLVDLSALFDILDEQSDVVEGDRALPVAAPAAAGGGEAGAAGGRAAGLGLEVNGATFGYLPERTILHEVDLSVAPGESVAFVGPSGSGKSSLMKLILRLYDPWSGRIQLDGMDVRNLTREALHSAIAVVPQDTVLFNDTLYSNILYGRPDAGHEQVLEAVEAACLGPALERMPEGLETVVGERGLKLSGGEKQRVAIARAFLKSPRLLLCDEATSALDSSTEAGIMDALTQLARGRTSVFVAHRLSTIQNCDKIVVLRHGRVKEQGSHAELMENGGLYCKMWRLQERAVEDAREKRVRKDKLASSLEV